MQEQDVDKDTYNDGVRCVGLPPLAASASLITEWQTCWQGAHCEI